MQTMERKTRRWSVEEYDQMADLGFFRDQRVELIDGEIIEMAPQKNNHVFCVTRVADALRMAFGPARWVRVQAPLDLHPDSQPEPDVAVVEGAPRPGSDHPRTALLVVEVRDTTLRYDRGEKASVYARHGIADYWVVNLEEGHLEIHRQPVPDDQQRFGARYASVNVVKKGQTVSPLAAAQASIQIADLLP
jgi:Uma2 family endonuclease